MSFCVNVFARKAPVSLPTCTFRVRFGAGLQYPRSARNHGVRMLKSGRDRGQIGYSRRDIRLFVDGISLEAGGPVIFSDAQSHYLRKVMRVAEGCLVKVFDGVTGEWWCEVSFSGKKEASGIITEQRRRMVEEPDVWVVFAAVKGDATENIIQKATELGASCFAPIISQRTVVKSLRLERMNLIAMEAAEQCERLSRPPTILNPQPLDDLISSWPPDRRLILCDETSNVPPLAALSSFPARSPAAIVVGPEGGWTGEELAQLRAVDGMVSISLGPRILRADTAVAAAMALYQGAAGDWTGLTERQGSDTGPE